MGSYTLQDSIWRSFILNNILIIPDAHVHPDYDNDRFTWLGRYIVDTKPTKIVCLGDFADMPSLSHYDKGKKGMEGKRYKKDVEHTHDAQDKLFAPIAEYNYKRSRSSLYHPERYMIEGNHDSDRGRIGKALELSPELDGVISVKDLRYKDYWGHVTPFKDVLTLDGLTITHYFPSGVMGRSIGGENLAASMLKKNLQSSIQGHTHILDRAIRTKADGQKCFALCAGCFVHHNYKEDWNANTINMWWNGVIVLGDVKDGMYSTYQEIPQSFLRKHYG